MLSRARLALLSVLAGASFAALAQATAPPLPAPPPPAPVEDEAIAPRATVRAIRVEGARSMPESALRDVTQPLEGRALSLADLRELERRLTGLYAERGFVTSGVVLRGVVDGVATYDAVEGTIAQVRFAAPPKVARAPYLTGLLVPYPDAPVRLGELQERMAALRDSGVVERIEARLEPLPQLGASELVISVEEPRRAWWAALQYDNYHSPTVGADRPSLVAGHRNVTGWGDTLEARIGDTEGLEDVRFAYSIPFARSRWRVGARYERSDSLAIDPPSFRSLEIKQVAETKALEIQHALPTPPLKPVVLGVSLEQRRAETTLLGLSFSFVPGLPDAVNKIDVARLFATASMRGDDTVAYARVQASYGEVEDVLPVQGAPDKRFASVLGQFQYARRLTPAGLQFVARVEGQYTPDTLVPIERFSVGGVSTLRGYRESLIVRDRALIGSAELRMPVLRHGDDIRIDAGVFIDAAWARNTQPPDSGYPTRLASVGVSVGLALPWGLFARIDYAIPNERWLTDRRDVQDRGLHYQLGWTFSTLIP